jgi:hypothetical protein
LIPNNAAACSVRERFQPLSTTGLAMVRRSTRAALALARDATALVL